MKKLPIGPFSQIRSQIIMHGLQTISGQLDSHSWDVWVMGTFRINHFQNVKPSCIDPPVLNPLIGLEVGGGRVIH